MPAERTLKLGILCLFCHWFSHHNKVVAAQLQLQTKRFSNQSLESVSVNRSFGRPFRYRKPEPRPGQTVVARQYSEVSVR